MAGFDHECGWPEELEEGNLAALMAGGRTGAYRKGCARWCRMIAGAIRGGVLEAREVVEVLHSPINRFAPIPMTRDPWLSQDAGHSRPDESKQETCTRRFITRPNFASWLRRIEETPSEHVQAWLISGEPMPAVAPTKTARNQNRNAVRMDRLAVAIEAGMKAYRAKHKTTPTAGDLWDWLGEHDDTGIIEETTLNKIVWHTSGGKLKDTSRKSFGNRLPRMRKRNPA